MAELGTIEGVDINRGIRPVDRQAETRAVAGALDLSTTLIEEGVKGVVTRDLVDAIDEVAEDNQVNQLPDLDPNEATLTQSLDRWKIQAEQGNASQRTLAEMRIKEVLVEAQSRYPWMAEKLQARAGMIVSGSYELEKLGLLDAARRTQAEQAQSNIDKIVDYGQLAWSKGGLGISVSVPVGSDEWMEQYQDLDKMRQGYDSNVRTAEMHLADREATATVLEQDVASMLIGEFSGVRASRHEAFSEHGFYAALNEATKGDSADPQVFAQFHGTGAPALIASMEATKAQVIANYENEYGVKLAGTDAGKRSRAMLDDFIREQDSMISALKQGVDMMPSAVQYIEAQNKIRGHNVKRGMTEPARNAMAFLGDPATANLLSIIDKTPNTTQLLTEIGLSDLASGTLSSFANSALTTGTPAQVASLAFVTSGQNSLPVGAGPDAVNREIAKQKSDSPNPYMVYTNTDREEAQAAVLSLVQMEAVWAETLKNPEFQSPDNAAMYLNSANYSLQSLVATRTRDPKVDELLLDSLASDNLLTSIDTVGDGVRVDERRAFGATAKEWYLMSDPDKRQAQAENAYKNTRIGQWPLSSLALVDIDSMSTEGQFNYEINEEKFKVVVDKRLKEESNLAGLEAMDVPGRARKVSRVQIENQLRNEIIQAMQPIALEVNRSITINRNLDAATSINVQARREKAKLQWFDQLGWLDIFNYNTPGQ